MIGATRQTDSQGRLRIGRLQGGQAQATLIWLLDDWMAFLYGLLVL